MRMENKRKLPIFWIVVLVIVGYVLVSRFVSNINENQRSKKIYSEKMNSELSWPVGKMGEMIPKIENAKGKLIEESEKSLSLEIYDMSEEDFKKYIEDSKLKGFTIDFITRDNSYSAKNSQGYELDIYRSTFDNLKEVSIRVKFMETKVETILEETKKEAEIIEESKNETHYEEINNIVDSDKDDKVVDNNITKEQNSDVSGIRPHIKEAIDSYEVFMNEYIELIEEYKNDTSNLEIVTKYYDMMNKSIEVSENFKKIEDEDLNIEELQYYLEVQNRITQRMLEVS